MKNFRAADKSHAGGDEKHDINFHWPKYRDFVGISLDSIIVAGYCRWKLSSGNLYTFIYRPINLRKMLP
jgi:hypothetical protein